MLGNKLITIEQAMKYFHDDMTLMYGGFGGVGNPPTLIDEILQKGIKDITLIGNDAGFPDVGIGRLVTAERVKKMYTTHIGSNPNAGTLMQLGKMDVEFFPQGIFAEKIRAGGTGIAGILTDVGMGTIVQEGKRIIEVDGKQCMMEKPLTAEVSIVYALKSDPFGNLIFDKSARNFNPLVAMAGDITIAEVEEIVELGELDPEAIVTSGVFVDYLVKSQGVSWQWAWAQK